MPTHAPIPKMMVRIKAVVPRPLAKLRDSANHAFRLLDEAADDGELVLLRGVVVVATCVVCDVDGWETAVDG